MVGGATVVGEKQQPERDLRNDQCLGQREQLRRPTLPARPRRQAANATSAETAHAAITRNAFT